MAKKTKKKGPTPPRTVRLEARGKPGQILPTVDRAKKKRRANLITAAIVLVIVGAAVTAAVVSATHKDKTPPGLSTGLAPWPSENAKLNRRIADLHLPGFFEDPAKKSGYHHHVHLDVFVAGTQSSVPVDIGHPSGGGLVAIHTHDATGIIHIEAASSAVFTLGDVFVVWGVRFDTNCVGGYCTDKGERVATYVNGKKLTGNPADYKLQSHDEIVVVVGDPPTPIPSTYTFPKGY